jgi:hypothetical protein
MRGLDVSLVGSTGDLKIAVGFNFRCGLVVNDLVGANGVVAVVDYYVSAESECVANAALVVGFNANGHSSGGRWLGLRDGKDFLSGVLWKLSTRILG